MTDRLELDTVPPGMEDAMAELSDRISVQVQQLLGRALDGTRQVPGAASAIIEGGLYGFLAVTFQLRALHDHPDLPPLETMIAEQVKLYLSDMAMNVAMARGPAGSA